MSKPKGKPNKCRYCGGAGTLMWTSRDGDDYGAQHTNPYDCILELRKQIAQISGCTAHLVTFG